MKKFVSGEDRDKIRLYQDDQDRKLRNYCETMGHKRPTSRREFLYAGIIPFSAYMLAPNFLQMLTASKALAADEPCPAGSNNFVPFIHINLSGGAAMSANWVPMDKGGGMLPSYDKMGMGKTPTLITDMGGAKFYNQSTLYSQLKTVATVEALEKTLFVGMCVQSMDDTSTNQFSAMGLVAKAGAMGSILPTVGTVNSPTGTNQQAAKLNPPSPLIVRSFNDISGAYSFQGQLRNYSVNQKKGIFETIKKLSGLRADQIIDRNGATTAKRLVACALDKNVELSSGAAVDTDVRQNAGLAAVWSVTPQTSVNDQNVAHGSIALNILVGNSAAGAIELGGYDYHDNTRTSGDAADGRAGLLIGRILESAKVLGKPCFIHVTSDGSVVSAVSDTGGAPWTSDRGSAGASYMILYNPTARPVLTGNLAQVGHYTIGQASDTSTFVGNSPEAAAASAFANWIKFSNASSTLIEKVLPGFFSPAQLTQVLRV